tara:strand:- start:240 stop:365 length:126 start_codon:yes stop_codon:yes gene_type:complete
MTNLILNEEKIFNKNQRVAGNYPSKFFLEFFNGLFIQVGEE